MICRLIVLIILTVATLVPPVFGQARGAQPQPQVEEPPPVLSVPPGYRYNPAGRRDPFVNPVPKPKDPEPEIPIVRPPGLRGVLVAEASLAGIIASKEPAMNMVIIQAPGNKTYFARRGDTLFDGVIKDIRPDAVVFTLMTPGNRGQQAVPAGREVVRKVRSTPGENK